ncbi:MAG: hypothetical protein WAM91_16615 [Candidatus Acidiferrales bacterium]
MTPLSHTRKPFLPNYDRKTYIRPTPKLPEKRVNAMTIAIAFQCKDGFVFASDRQMSHGRATDFGGFSHYEAKTFGIESESFSAVVCGSGNHGDLIRPFAETVFANLGEAENLSLEHTRTIMDATLGDLAHRNNAAPDASFLLAVVRGGEQQFLRSDGLVIRTAGPVEILGIGDTSLVRYLTDSIYSPDLGSLYAVCFAAYAVYAAKKYCPQYCGGATDVHVLTGGGKESAGMYWTGWNVVKPDEVTALEDLFARRAKEHLLGVIEEASDLLSRR